MFNVIIKYKDKTDIFMSTDLIEIDRENKTVTMYHEYYNENMFIEKDIDGIESLSINGVDQVLK